MSGANVIQRRGTSVKIEAEAPGMIEALMEGLEEAEGRGWHR